jgi:uncharacterized protein involved in outer membrane biogenesis
MALSVLVLLLLGAVLVVHLWLDAWIKSTVEHIGPIVTGTTVTLDAIRTSLLFGTVELRGLAIGNPPGFRAPHAFKVGSLRVRVSWLSLAAPVLVVEEIVIDAPEVTIEGLHPNDNLSRLQHNVRTFSEKGMPKPAAAGKPAEPRNVQLREFVMKDGKASVQFSVTGVGGQSLSVGIPDLHLKDIGQGGGVPPEKLAAALTDAVVNAITGSVGSQLKQAGRKVEQAATDILGQAEGLFKKQR